MMVNLAAQWNSLLAKDYERVKKEMDMTAKECEKNLVELETIVLIPDKKAVESSLELMNTYVRSLRARVRVLHRGKCLTGKQYEAIMDRLQTVKVILKHI